jgi:hypothetical protein
MAVVEETLSRTNHIDHLRKLVDIYLPRQPSTIFLGPEGLGPVADIAEVNESENPAKLSRVKEQRISPEGIQIHGNIVRAFGTPVKGVL